MGNQVARGQNRMAIAAMANVTHVEKKDLKLLLSHFKDRSIKEGTNNMISRTSFTEVLTECSINQNDVDILDRLFTMYDKTGDDLILYKDFIVGVSPFITGSYMDKIEFAFKLYDIDNTYHLRGTDMINVLSQINRVSSYFGDPVLTEEQISVIIKESLNITDKDTSLSTFIKYTEYVKIISDHPLVETFLSGGGTVQYGSGR
jgi:Ca2+-binding EF-hand superfamily protein